MDCSLPCSSVHGISQAGVLEGVAMPFSRGPPQIRDQTWVSCIGRPILYHWATREIPGGQKQFLLFKKTRGTSHDQISCYFPFFFRVLNKITMGKGIKYRTVSFWVLKLKVSQLLKPKFMAEYGILSQKYSYILGKIQHIPGCVGPMGSSVPFQLLPQ